MSKRRQAIIWTKADLVPRGIYAALGGDELTSISLLSFINSALFLILITELAAHEMCAYWPNCWFLHFGHSCCHFSSWNLQIQYNLGWGVGWGVGWGGGWGGPDQAPPPVLPITDHIMMSSNGNFFHIAGHLCREFTGHWLMFPLIYAWLNG